MSEGTSTEPYVKDPDSIRTFGIDWASFLNGQSFVSSEWAVINPSSGAVQIESDTTSSTIALVKLSGGTLTKRYALRNRVTRTDGERDDQTIYVKIREK